MLFFITFYAFLRLITKKVYNSFYLKIHINLFYNMKKYAAAMFVQKFWLSLALVLCLSLSKLTGQVQETDNYTYSDQIKTIQTTVAGQLKSLPILSLRGSQVITLMFDDLGHESDHDYYYRIIHCDRDWQKSIMDPIEFVDGLQEASIRNRQASLGTLQPFTHYWVNLPNRDSNFKLSGNYIIQVYDHENDDAIVLTRRIVVAENSLAVNGKFVRPTNANDIRFKQQLNLEVHTNGLAIKNPMRDVTFALVQNGDWKNILQNIKPRNFMNNTYTFDNFGALAMSGFNEFRNFDIRRLLSRGYGVEKITNGAEGLKEVYLNEHTSRANKAYVYDFDFNGNFYINNEDVNKRIIFNNSNPDRARLSEFRDFLTYTTFKNNTDWENRQQFVSADYANVTFSFKTPKLDNEVYVYGAFTDFHLKEEAKMDYDTKDGVYFITMTLKQGYYDFMFAEKGKEGKPIFKNTEGEWQETENEYMLFIYHRDFASRYDRVIQASTLYSFL
jgi:hypothetical protein